MLINLDHITVDYGKADNKTYGLHEVSLTVKEGEFLTIMGKSGCGKSTLLNVLGTIRKPTAGNYYFRGEEITCLKDKRLASFRNKNIGFVVQHFALINEYTVADNIALPMQYQKRKVREREKCVDEILEKMDLKDKKYVYPYKLSGGQQQRVAIARAMITKPQLLLADEPTGSLDEENGMKIMELLKEANKEGTTVIMVTHDLELAKMGDRCIKMRDGRIEKIPGA